VYYTDWSDIPKDYYNTILCDPPWPYKDKMKGHSFSLDHEYETQSKTWLKDLPVKSISAKDSLLLLWATSPNLPLALEVMQSWGFKYKTIAFVWSKLTKHGKRVSNLGRWTMGNVEIVLLGTRGKPQRLSKNVKQFLEAERTVHSRKPNAIRQRIEQLMGGPYIELFARGASENWDQFGNCPTFPTDS